MSGSLNKVTLIGNVGQDPIIQSFPDGNQMARFSICTNEKWTNKKTNEKITQTEWHKVVVHVQGMIPYIQNYIKKGAHLYVEGILKNRSYTKDGIEKMITEIHIKGYNHTVMMLGSSKKEDPEPADHYPELDDEIGF